VLKNVTITLDAEVAHWARRKAAEENISVSKLLARMLEREMRASDSYWRAFAEWKKRDRDLGVGIDASKRFTRDQAHER
jgi:cytidylate kinase